MGVTSGGEGNSRLPIKLPRARVELVLLGSFSLRRDRVEVPLPLRTERVLAFLALHDRPITRAQIALRLWPGSRLAQAQASLRAALWQLHPSSDVIVYPNRHDLALSSAITVDLRAQMNVAQGHLRAERRLGNAYRDIETLRQDLLPDWYDEWLAVERERNRQLRLHALEALAERLSRAGRFADAAEAALAAVRDDPLRESAHRTLIAVYVAEGNLCDAKRHVEYYCDLSRGRLGMEPSPRFWEVARYAGGNDEVTER